MSVRQSGAATTRSRVRIAASAVRTRGVHGVDDGQVALVEAWVPAAQLEPPQAVSRLRSVVTQRAVREAGAAAGCGVESVRFGDLVAGVDAVFSHCCLLLRSQVGVLGFEV